MNRLDTARRALLWAVCVAWPVRAVLAQTGSPPGAAATEDLIAKSILEKADQVRFPQEGFQVDISIVTRADGQVTDERRYRVLSKGNENTIVMVTEPASERGQIMLMKGRDLWVFLPSVSQPVRLSLAQRLTGQVANGDLARANFAGDYIPRLLGTESVDGVRMHLLELTGVDRGVTYPRVLFHVREADGFPYRAEFMSASGRVLKTCEYQEFRKVGGRVRPTRLVMTDALRKAEQSVLEYSEMKLRDLPDKVFTKEYLKRLE